MLRSPPAPASSLPSGLKATQSAVSGKSHKYRACHPASRVHQSDPAPLRGRATGHGEQFTPSQAADPLRQSADAPHEAPSSRFQIVTSK
jgi:hypothetical protein